MSNTEVFADVLGYHYPNYFEITDSRILARCNEILVELDNIDTQIKTAHERMMAKQVGDLSLDYLGQIYQYRQTATMLLKELSFRSGIPLVFNKYKSSSSVSTFTGGSVF